MSLHGEGANRTMLPMVGYNSYGAANQAQEQDANSALMELDIGLRSPKIGEQSEAIVRFPCLFQKYPFPILINSAFLKLADIFRTGNNFLRLCVLRVTQQSEKHLEKILNVDELLKKIFSVIYSNDPLGRALTLRTLGSLAPIISERKNVHHSIRSSLDSNDAVEVEAAIYAAKQFAACSSVFATNICDKISDIIGGLATPVEMKLKLIPIFQHMHRDPRTSTRVRQMCNEMLPLYPAENFVLVTLHTLTQLSAVSLLDISEQIQLLLSYLTNDSRIAVRLLCLRDLKKLAQIAPHLWNEKALVMLINNCIDDTHSEAELQLSSLKVLTTLAKTIAVEKLEASGQSQLIRFCLDTCYSSCIVTSSQAIQLGTALILHKNMLNEFLQQIFSAIEIHIVNAGANVTQSDKVAFKNILKCSIDLCFLDDSCTADLVLAMSELLLFVDRSIAIMLCEALAAIGSKKPEALNSCITQILNCVNTLAASAAGQSDKVVVLLTTVLFQLNRTRIEPDVFPVIQKTVDNSSQWDKFCIARQAARYGHHVVASAIFENLTSVISSEHFFFWLCALRDFTFAEASLSAATASLEHHSDNLSQAIMSYQKGISSLKAANTPNFAFQFQKDFIQLRVSTLQAHVKLRYACNSLRTCPPPALTITIGDQLQRLGKVGMQLQESFKQFQNLSSRYNTLYQSCFDADSVSLAIIQKLQLSCHLMAQRIDTILNSCLSGRPRNRLFSGGAKKNLLAVAQETVSLEVMCLQSAMMTILSSSTVPAGPHEHANMLADASKLLISVPLCFPRFFFQTLQQTNIKLAFTPQPKNTCDRAIIVFHETSLALKVEGVIQHGAKPGIFRRVHSVCLKVTSSLTKPEMVRPNAKLPTISPNEISKTAVPHNDYFSLQFLLSFSYPGLYVLHIDTYIVDCDGKKWCSGSQNTLLVKSLHDSSHAGQHRSALQFQSQRFP